MFAFKQCLFKSLSSPKKKKKNSNILRIWSANLAYREIQRKQFCHLMNKLSTLYI